MEKTIFMLLNLSFFNGRNDAHAAATAAGLPYGPSHAAQHARHDGNEFWSTDAWWHANTGLIYIC